MLGVLSHAVHNAAQPPHLNLAQSCKLLASATLHEAQSDRWHAAHNETGFCVRVSHMILPTTC